MLTYTRAEMKQAAKDSLDGKWGTSIGALLLVMVVPGAVLGIVTGLMGFMSGLCSYAGAYGAVAMISTLTWLLSLAFAFLILGPLTMAYYFFFLRLVRGMGVKATMPYQCFAGENYGRLTLAYFMQSLFILLWSLLLIVPGIIKALSYAMMPYIMMDHPEMGWQEAINESKRMMDGHKGDLFVLYLSFILWLLLVEVTCGIAILYVGPYMQATVANFYRSLKEESIGVVRPIPNEFTA